jgi:hypothetical protein
MIKFKTINGTLCRMVEPTPLQLDSEFPVAMLDAPTRSLVEKLLLAAIEEERKKQ